MGKVWSIVYAGLVAGGAYLAAQTVDLAVARNRIDDRVMLARLTPAPANNVRIVGAGLHLLNSVVFAAVFRLAVKDRIHGPMWWRGVLFANVENLGLYWIALFEDFHPAIRDGELDSYQSWTAFSQGIWRHTVMGAVLGLLTPRRGIR